MSVGIFRPSGGGGIPVGTFTAKGDLVAGQAGSSYVAVGVGVNGLFLKADSTVAGGMGWASPAGSALNVSTLTGATTLTTSNNVVLVSGTTFAITLPTTIGNAGSVIQIKKIDSGFLTPISVIGATSAHTIDGSAGVTLQTQWESFQFVADGLTGWSIRDHTIDSTWNYGVSFVAGGLSAPFGTVANATFLARRVGSNLEVLGYWQMGTVAASKPSINLPSGIQTNTSNIPGSTLRISVGTWRQLLNTATVLNSNDGDIVVDTLGATLVWMAQRGQGNAYETPVLNTNGGFFTSSAGINVRFSIEVLGWHG